MSLCIPVLRIMRSALVIPSVLAVAALPAAAAGETVPLAVETVPLNPENERQVRAGALLYRGGLAIRSPDRRFGGFSGLAVSPDGRRLTAVSDRGILFRARMRHDGAGRLAGLTGGRIGLLRGPDGRPLQGPDADAEALAVLPDGTALVAFERRHRILRYPVGPHSLSRRPVRFPVPAGLAAAPFNGGAETLADIGGGNLLLLAENLRRRSGAYAGWIGRQGGWQPFAYARSGGFRPTDATALPDGNVAVLERHYSPATGVSARVVVLSRHAVAPGRTVRGREILRLDGSMTVDNFEGIAARRDRNGKTVLYILSDDNFNPLQRTLLLTFEMP